MHKIKNIIENSQNPLNSTNITTQRRNNDQDNDDQDNDSDESDDCNDESHVITPMIKSTPTKLGKKSLYKQTSHNRLINELVNIF